MKQRQALADVTGPRYRKAGKTDKSHILDEFCTNTGYNRKYTISVFRGARKIRLRILNGKTVKVNITAKTREKRPRQRYYGGDVEKPVTAPTASAPGGNFQGLFWP